MELRELNNNKITVKAGLSNGLLGNAFKTGRGLNSESIEKILNAYPEINAEWLLTGKGEMLKKEEASGIGISGSYEFDKVFTKCIELTRENEDLRCEIERLKNNASSTVGVANVAKQVDTVKRKEVETLK